MESAQWARRVVGIDRSPDVLKRAKALAERRGVKNITWKRGDMEKLPLEDASVDIALLSQALHHAANPGARDRRSGAHSAARRPACWRSICANTIKNGCAIASAIAGSASKTRISSGF